METTDAEAQSTEETSVPSDTALAVPENEGWVTEFGRFEKRIKKSDDGGLRLRWECGRYMLTLKQGEQLPRGVLATLEKAYDVRRWELSARMKFAEKYPTDVELSDVIKQFPTWFDITHKALKNSHAGPETTARESSAVMDGQVMDEQDAEQEEPRKHRSVTPKLRRVVDLLEGIESADLSDQDLVLLSAVAQLAERHREAAITLREDEACERPAA